MGARLLIQSVKLGLLCDNIPNITCVNFHAVTLKNRRDSRPRWFDGILTSSGPCMLCCLVAKLVQSQLSPQSFVVSFISFEMPGSLNKYERAEQPDSNDDADSRI